MVGRSISHVVSCHCYYLQPPQKGRYTDFEEGLLGSWICIRICCLHDTLTLSSYVQANGPGREPHRLVNN